LAYSSALTTEVICSSETWLTFHRTIRRCIPENLTLHSHRYENLKTYLVREGSQRQWNIRVCGKARTCPNFNAPACIQHRNHYGSSCALCTRLNFTSNWSHVATLHEIKQDRCVYNSNFHTCRSKRITHSMLPAQLNIQQDLANVAVLRLFCMFYIFAYPGFVWLIRRVLESMIEFIGLYSLYDTLSIFFDWTLRELFRLRTELSIIVGFSLYSLGSDHSTKKTHPLPSDGYMRTHIENTTRNTGFIVACVYCGRCLEMGLLYCWLRIFCGLVYRAVP
jgi:hypothetical protein